jgi:hypothetical protein
MTVLVSLLVIGAGAAVFYFEKPTPRINGSYRSVEIMSVSGVPMASLFIGIPPNPKVLQSLRKANELRPAQCTAPRRLANRLTRTISKLGDLLGVTPGVVHAQPLCSCGTQPQEYDCSGGEPCGQFVVDQPVAGYGGTGTYTEFEDFCGDPENYCQAEYEWYLCTC